MRSKIQMWGQKRGIQKFMVHEANHGVFKLSEASQIISTCTILPHYLRLDNFIQHAKTVLISVSRNSIVRGRMCIEGRGIGDQLIMLAGCYEIDLNG